MRLPEIGKPLRLILRELARNRRRTLLTFVGLVISFFLYTSLESILYTMNGLLSGVAGESLLFLQPRDRAGFFQPSLPRGYAGQIRDLPGVVAASPIRLHIGEGREEGSFVAALGIEVDSYLRIRPLSVDAAALDAFRASRTGALVGDRLQRREGWRVGDEVTIRGQGRVPPLTFSVSGFLDEGDRFGSGVLLHLDYLDDVLGGRAHVTFIQVRVEDASRAGAIGRAIDDHFRNFSVPTEAITEKAHIASILGSLAGVLGAFRAIGYLALAVTMLVVGNTVAMNVRERTVEIGTLRALGFGRRRVVALVLGEAMIVALLGGLLGAGSAYVLFSSGVISVPQGLRFATDWTLIVQSALLSLLVGALAALQPAWSAVRMSITDALRYAE